MSKTMNGHNIFRKRQPVLEQPDNIEFSFRGIIGKRIMANQNNWLLTQPIANPAMIEMFRTRDSGVRNPPSRDLSWWSGEYAGKYLISGIQTLRITRDERLRTSLALVVNNLINIQSPDDNYLGPFELNKRWIGRDGKSNAICGSDGCPLWDLWGHYHVMLGLYLWYLWSGDSNALNACKRAADLLVQTFPGSGRPVSVAGAQPMNQALIHIFAILYQETGEGRYLNMVKEIEEDWTRPNSGDYLNSALEGKEFYEFPNHGNRWESLHDIQAIAELYFITGDNKYRQAFEHIWTSIVNHDKHNTGGFSSGEEATGNPYDPRPIETCATVAWIALTVDMLRITGSSLAADELEIATWNAVLGAQSVDGKWWTYNTPMGGVRIPPLASSDICKGVSFLGERRPTLYDLDFQQSPGNPQLSCCSANGPRGLGTLSEWAVMMTNDGITVNYYGPSTFTLNFMSTGNRITLVQETDYPLSGQINLTVIPENSEEFALRLRIPWWSKSTKVQINGGPQTRISSGEYHLIRRVWRPNDRITLLLDISPRTLLGGRPSSQLGPCGGDTSGKFCIYVGPILLAYDPRFDVYDPRSLPGIDITNMEIVEPTGHEPKAYSFFRFSTTIGARPITLCDFASAGAMNGPYLSGLPLASKVWQFSRENDNSIIASKLRLMVDGSIQGHSHPNEARWGLEGDTIVFFAENRDVSTRFTIRDWGDVKVNRSVNHRMVLKGEFSFNHNIKHVLSELDMAIINKIWQFGRENDNSIIASKLRLMVDGSIQGHSHPNEARWGLEGDTIVFFAENGDVTTRFTDISTHEGKMMYKGRFLDSPIIHVLNEIDFAWNTYVSWFPVPI